MKGQKKYFVVVIVIAMLVQILSFTLAAGSEPFSYESNAQTLYDLGLYNGTSGNSFTPDLGASLDRQTGIVMLLKLFGLADDALAMSDADTAAALAKFSDKSDIDNWAMKYVAFAAANNLVLGTTETTFSPKDALVGQAYCTLILRQLGYVPNYNTAPSELAGAGGLTYEQALLFSGKALIKDDLVGISFGSLTAIGNNGSTVLDQLMIGGIIDKGAAINAGLVPGVVDTPPPAKPPTKVEISNDNDDDDDDDDNDNDDSDDDDIIGTGVTGSSMFIQGSDGAKEVNKLVVTNSLTTPESLSINISDNGDIVLSDSFEVVAGDEATVANAVYSKVAGELANYDVSLDDNVIIFTAKIEAENRNLAIELKKASAPSETMGTANLEISGMLPVKERVEYSITNGAARTGILKLNVDLATVNVSVLAGETEQQVAEKLLDSLNTDAAFATLQDAYVIDNDGELIIFVAKTTGNKSDLKITLE